MSARILVFVSLSCLVSAYAERASGEPGSESSGVLVSLRAGVENSSLGERNVLGMLTLNVPLERFAAQRAKSRTQADPAPEPVQAEPAPDEAPAVEDEQEAERPEAVADEEPAFLLTHELVRGALARAFALAGHARARLRLDGMAARARASAALPELRVRGARGTDESLRLSPTLDDPYRYTRAGGTNLLFEARATWKLDRLLFADEELGVERLRGERARARTELAERVLKTLFAWQRADLNARDRSARPEKRALSRLLAFEAELTLDVLTAGWFSETRRLARAEAARARRVPALQSKGRPSRQGPRQGAGQDRQQGVDNARHACRDTHFAPGPQAARRCAKGVSLTSRHSDAK